MVEGRVTNCLPNAMFRVNVKIGEGDSHSILAHLSGKVRINNINILEGDLVKIEMSPYDLTRGRITYRFKE